jgi:hypothetical protein
VGPLSNQPLTIYFVGGFFFVASLLPGFEGNGWSVQGRMLTFNDYPDFSSAEYFLRVCLRISLTLDSAVCFLVFIS